MPREIPCVSPGMSGKGKDPQTWSVGPSNDVAERRGATLAQLPLS